MALQVSVQGSPSSVSAGQVFDVTATITNPDASDVEIITIRLGGSSQWILSEAGPLLNGLRIIVPAGETIKLRASMRPTDQADGSTGISVFGFTATGETWSGDSTVTVT